MPVSTLFSMARRKLVSPCSASCARMRLRVWRQVASSSQAVMKLSTPTSQNRPLLTRPSEVW
ncbi:hypothetical protein D3C72_1137300 [compost metagenome]